MMRNFGFGVLALVASGCFPELKPPDGGDSDEETGWVDTNDSGGETGGETGEPCPDADGDGHADVACGGTDCNDADPDANPDGTEVCNGVDDNCDGTVDEATASDADTWYADTDSDGYGNSSVTSVACEKPDGFVADATDCDDTNGAAFPGNTEVCDEVDNNCSGTTDEGVTTTFYADIDEDGYGADSLTQDACSAPTGYSELGGDCDDANTAYNPGASEEDCADPNDYNCDGSTGYTDADGDGWAACTECDDSDITINPDASEVCNGVDDNCDGSADEDQIFADWYADADSDGYGAGAAVSTCDGAPAGYVESDSDCDDSDASAYPSAPEDCTSSDDLNCDGSAGGDDSDGDGYRSCEECDDANPDANPGEVEMCDEYKVDEDCDGLADDGDPDVTGTSTWYYDGGDHDGWGLSSSTVEACNEVVDYVEIAGDCDDTNDTINPGATETCDSVDEDCDGSVDEDLTCTVDTGGDTGIAPDTGDSGGDSGDTASDTGDSSSDSGSGTDTGGGTDTSGGGDTGIAPDTGDSDTGDSKTVFYTTDFGDGGTCSYSPFSRSDGGSMAYASYDDGAGGCGVYIFGSGSSSSPYISLDYSASGYTPSVTYTTEMSLENLTASSLTVYADFGGGSIASQSVGAGSTATFSFTGTSDSSGAATLRVWTSYGSNYGVVAEDLTISY